MKHLRNQATCERKTSALMEFEVEDSHVMGICTILKHVRCKNREKNTSKEKNNNTHTQNSIYMIWQFAYVHGVTKISLFSRKK